MTNNTCKAESYTTKESLRDGNHSAYREVFIHFWKPIHQFLTCLIRDEEVAREMTQDIFVNLWEKREQIDPSKNLKSYLYTIARNSAIKHFDHQKVLNKYESWHQSQDLSQAPCDSLMMEDELQLITEIAVSRMPQKQRKAIELSIYEGFDSDKIAQIMGINKGTVATYLSVGRKEIKEILSRVMFFIL